MLKIVLLIIAIILFALDAFGVSPTGDGKPNLQSLGLAFFAGAFLA